MRARIFLNLLACAVAAPLLIAGAPALAVQPEEILSDPALEQRARTISKDLRCVQCQNQSIDDSDAPIAQQMRVMVRERLLAGDTDDQVKDRLVQSYGEFVLLTPKLSAQNFIIWLTPPLALLLGGFWYLRRTGRLGGAAPEPAAVAPIEGPAPLTDEERRRLDAILKE